MTLKSSCSVFSDDENSRQSFLSECDSEFDLSPPPRYPAEKRSPSKSTVSRIEPPLTRSRAKATGKSVIETPQPLSLARRHSTTRSTTDSLSSLTNTFKNSLSKDQILFPPPPSPSSTLNNRVPNSPIDGVNKLADWFESCSLDEDKFGSCLWPSRETTSRYMRQNPSSPIGHGFGANPLLMSNTSPIFLQTSSSATMTRTTLFGQRQEKQAQLWSRFRLAASTIRNSLWLEQVEQPIRPQSTSMFTDNPFDFTDHSLLVPSPSPQTVPSRSITFQSKITPSTPPPPESSFKPQPPTFLSPNQEAIVVTRPSFSKFFFTFIIFAIGLLLGYLLTNTLPPSSIRQWIDFLWQTIHLLINRLSTRLQLFISPVPV